MTKRTKYYGQQVKQRHAVGATERDAYFFEAGRLGCRSLKEAKDVMEAARTIHRVVIDRSNGEASDTQEKLARRAKVKIAELVTGVRYDTQDPRTFLVAVSFGRGGEVVVPVGGIVS